MAIYHLAAKVGSRNSGQSAAATFAYLCQEDRYSRDVSELVHAESHGLPAWAASDPALYWKSADQYERANGRLYQQVEISLPIELTAAQQIALAQAFAVELAALPDGALPYTLVVHRGHGRNPHAHILLSERIVDGHDRTPATWFRRAAVAGQRSSEHGGAKKTTAFQPRSWITDLRARWAAQANAALEQAGQPARIDPRSHAARGIPERPTVHEGPLALRARERGLPDDRAALNAEIRAANLQLGDIRTQSPTAQLQLDALQRQLGQSTETPLTAPVSTPGPTPEVLRFLELHRKDFTTCAESARWFDREITRLRTLTGPATARALFDDSLAAAEPDRADFGNILHQALVAPRWQAAPLSVAVTLQQTRREIADWQRTAAEIQQQIAEHRDPRSLWRRLLSADQRLLSLHRERDSALAQIELHRATIDRIEARWEAEQSAWELEAAQKNAARREKQHQAADRLRTLSSDVLAELERREHSPNRRSPAITEQADYIRKRLSRGLTPQELWLDMLLLNDYTLEQQDDLDALIREMHAAMPQQSQPPQTRPAGTFRRATVF
ncbi:MAG TPA: MobA/MobL family protein [Granulicella sp.]|nr:MobA/MobL family protein [Granulicella sp.]